MVPGPPASRRRGAGWRMMRSPVALCSGPLAEVEEQTPDDG